MPVLTEEEKSAIGPYEEQYAFLRSLAENEALLKEFTPAESFEAMLVGDAGNSENYLKVLEESRRVRRLQTGLANFYRSTVGKREALKQPHKLRPVFDEAFRKKVLTPVEQLLKIAPYIEEELRHLASASLIYANEPANEQKAGLLKEYLRRYREVSEDGNKIIREVRGGE